MCYVKKLLICLIDYCTLAEQEGNALWRALKAREMVGSHGCCSGEGPPCFGYAFDVWKYAPIQAIVCPRPLWREYALQQGLAQDHMSVFRWRCEQSNLKRNINKQKLDYVMFRKPVHFHCCGSVRREGGYGRLSAVVWQDCLPMQVRVWGVRSPCPGAVCGGLDCIISCSVIAVETISLSCNVNNLPSRNSYVTGRSSFGD